MWWSWLQSACMNWIFTSLLSLCLIGQMIGNSVHILEFMYNCLVWSNTIQWLWRGLATQTVFFQFNLSFLQLVKKRNWLLLKQWIYLIIKLFSIALSLSIRAKVFSDNLKDVMKFGSIRESAGIKWWHYLTTQTTDNIDGLPSCLPIHQLWNFDGMLKSANILIIHQC